MSELNRQITVKGDFQRAVIVNDSFVNGKDCVYIEDTSTYSHAEGYCSKASGMYSHADGVKAEASHDYSFVWSGANPESNIVKQSKAKGTFSIYTNGYVASDSCSAIGLKEIYINGVTAEKIHEHYKNSAISEIRNNDNTLTESLYLSGSTDAKNFHLSNKISFINNGTSQFKGTVSFSGDTRYTGTEKSVSTSDNTIATCKFVHSVVQSYLKNIFGDDIIKTSE